MTAFITRTSIGLAALLSASLGWAQLTTQTIVTGLSSPVQMVQDPVNLNVFYVVQQTGRVRVIKDGVLQANDYINLTTKITTNTPLGERGLLGMEFAPDYATSGFVYFNYSNRNGIGDTQISRFSRSATNPLAADIATEFKILTVVQPFENHNGGCIRFGPDGYLYIGMGDGGDGNDPGQRAQNPNTLLGKMLRINVNQDAFPADPERNYAIPPDNPFVDGVPITAMGEIWDFGFRNPYRWSFDRASMGGTNALVIGDVGQDSWEEVDYEPAGAGGRNYGWRIREGMHSTGLGGSTAFTPLKDPVHEYPHGTGTSITGGYVYRGSLLSGFQGRYFSADFIQKRVWSLGLNIDGMGEATAGSLIEHTTELGGSTTVGNISSIDVDSKGELYLLSYGGTLKRLIPSGPIPVSPNFLNVTIGTLTSGGLPQILVSDDSRLTINHANVQGPQTEVIVEGTSPRLTSSQITISLEALATVTGIAQQVEAFNFSTGQYVLLDSIATGPTEIVRTLSITTNASQFIQPGTGKVRVRLKSFSHGERRSSWDWSADRVGWVINP